MPRKSLMSALLPSLRQCSAESPCVIWTGDQTDAGYGRAWHNSQRTTAHRMAYELVRGPIPERATIDHLCRRRLCVNPYHLEAVPHRENCIRATVLKTHCPHGHAYEGDNVRVYQGRRFCRECHRVRGRARYQRAGDSSGTT